MVSNLLTRETVAVWSEGDRVAIKFGMNEPIWMPYAAAFKISAWLRIRAKEAKRVAGDTSRHWSVIGTLTAKE